MLYSLSIDTLKPSKEHPMKIYVGTYRKYNEGSIAGEWLDIEDYSDKEEFLEACKALHSDEEDPELMFQDMEDIPEGMATESFVSEELFEYAQMDEDDRELLRVYRSEVNSSGDLKEAQNHFHGRYSSAEDYAQEITEQQGDIPDHLKNYIDYEAMARDMGFEGYTFAMHEGECWVFSS